MVGARREIAMIDGLPFKQIGEVKRGGMVCVADHASSFVPDDVQLGVPANLLATHIGVDIGVDGVVARLARRLGIPAHVAQVSRLVVDLHREADNPAVVPTESDGHLIPGNIGADVEMRLKRYYHPYHSALAKWLDAADPELIISLHSFTPKLETSGEDRPWDVGLLYNEDDRAARQAIRLFREQGLTVGENEPYSGKQLNATMNRHAEAHGRYYCAIEIRNDLIRTRAEQARWATMVADVAGRVALALD